MKRNAILIAGILFVAGCASNRDHYGRAGLETGTSSSDYNASVDTSSHHIAADSSVRGGSMAARGYDQNWNDQELATHPMNPAYQADSSIRGGSLGARNSDWNTRPEPSSGYGDTHIKADSSKRGGSMDARGYNRFSADYTDHTSNYQSNNNSSMNDDAANEADLRSDSDLAQGGFDAVIIEGPFTVQEQPLTNEDFGQGGSERLGRNDTSDPNYNPSDDLMRDDKSNSSSAVGGSAETSVGKGSSNNQNLETSKSNLDDLDIQSTSDDSADQSGSNEQSSARKSGQLNSSVNLEKDLKGEYNTSRNLQNSPNQSSSTSQTDISSDGRLNTDSQLGSTDPNARDTFESSVNSSRSSDIRHDSSDINSSVTSEASGTANLGERQLFQLEHPESISGCVPFRVRCEILGFAFERPRYKRFAELVDEG